MKNEALLLTVDCPSGWFYNNDRCYKVMSGKQGTVSWLKAEQQCQQENGHLASTNTKSELLYIRDMLREYWEVYERDSRKKHYIGNFLSKNIRV